MSIRNSIRTGEKEFDHTAFIELFTAHLLEKNSRSYHLRQADICEIKMLQHEKSYKKKEMSLFSNKLLTF